MAKETPAKNTALEADVLKAAEGAVDQKAVKDKATDTAGPETVQGKTETMQGQPGPGIQMPGSDLPAATGTVPGNFGNPGPGAQADAEYLEFLEWKRKKDEGTLQSTTQEREPVVDDYQAKERAAQEAARKAYNAIMDGQALTGAPVVDTSKTTDATSLHEQRLKMYGPGYVVAKRQGVEQVFTQQTWRLLGGRNNKDGYTEVVAAPPEVQALNKNA